MTERGDRTAVIKGAGALSEMLLCIGDEARDDHDVAMILAENEIVLRVLLAWTLETLAKL